MWKEELYLHTELYLIIDVERSGRSHFHQQGIGERGYFASRIMSPTENLRFNKKQSKKALHHGSSTEIKFLKIKCFPALRRDPCFVPFIKYVIPHAALHQPETVHSLYVRQKRCFQHLSSGQNPTSDPCHRG